MSSSRLGIAALLALFCGCGGSEIDLGQTGTSAPGTAGSGGGAQSMGAGGKSAAHGGASAGGSDGHGGASASGGSGHAGGGGKGQGANGGSGQGASAGKGQGASGGSGQGASAGNGQGANGGTGQGANGGTAQGANGGTAQGANGGTAQGANGGTAQGANGGTGQGANAGQGANGGTGQGASAGTGQGANSGFGGSVAGSGGVSSGGSSQAGAGGVAQGGTAGQAGKGGGSSGSAGKGVGGGGGSGASAGTSSVGGTSSAGGTSQGTGGAGGGCMAGTGFCVGNVATHCKADGSGFIKETCDATAGVFCDPPTGTCKNPCEALLVGTNNIGCEYFPTVTSNGQLFDLFHFAVSVANTTLAAAHVTVLRNGAKIATATVPAGGLSTITLPWVEELRHQYTTSSEAEMETLLTSTIVKGGSYILESDTPVTVFQFNPLEYEIPEPPDGSCPDPHNTGACNSFTNDASLLIPRNALGTEYIVASHQSLSIQEVGENFSLPGFVAITASDNDTQVQFTSAGFVRGGDGVKAMAPGDTQMFTMQKGDVLQLLTAPVGAELLTNCVNAKFSSVLCEVPGNYDLTGSFVSATKPVSVIGGHDCTFMPYDHFACDHIEQSIFPLDTWGSSAIVTAPQSVKGAPKNDQTPDPEIVRIISGADGNHIVLDPPVPGFGITKLDKGKYVDVPMTSKDMVISGTGPLLAVQYMLGGDLVDPDDISLPTSKGDPSMSLAAPTSQYRRLYTFLAPESYQFNFMNVVGPAGAAITLDGKSLPMGGATAIGASGYTVLRHAISGGAHTIKSDQPFGIIVYGYGTYTSYMYPGGLDLEH